MTKAIIETERLLLREIDPEHDFEGWAQAFADADTVRYLGVDVMNRYQAWRSMAVIMGHWQIRGFGFFSVIEKETGQWVGRIGHWFPEGYTRREVGWTLHPDFTGKGYATEAARACIDYAFETLGWDEVVHLIAPENSASVKVAEKLGSSLFERLESMPGLYENPILVYGQKKP